MRLHLIEEQGDGSPVHGLVLGVANYIWNMGSGDDDLGNFYAAQNSVRSWSEALDLRTAGDVVAYVNSIGMPKAIREIYEKNKPVLQRLRELEALQL